MRKILDKSHLRNILQNTRPVLFKTVKVVNPGPSELGYGWGERQAHLRESPRRVTLGRKARGTQTRSFRGWIAGDGMGWRGWFLREAGR